LSCSAGHIRVKWSPLANFTGQADSTGNSLGVISRRHPQTQMKEF